MRTRFWIEAALGTVSGALLVMTLLWNDWIEALTGIDPDRHSGSIEWLLAGALLGSMLLFGEAARRERRVRARCARPAFGR